MKAGEVFKNPEGLSNAYFALAEYIGGVAQAKGDGNVVLMGIKNDGEKVLNHLVEQYNLTLPYGFIDATFNRDDVNGRNIEPKGQTEIPACIDDKHVILIDSVHKTGRTARAAMSGLIDYGRPASIGLVVLVKRGGHQLPIHPDYAAMEDGEIPLELKVKLQVKDGIHSLVLQ